MRESGSPFFHSWAYLPPPHRNLEGNFPHSSSRGQPLASTVDESFSFMARRVHWSVGLMVKAEAGKVGRARDGRAVVGENGRMAIAGGDRYGRGFTRVSLGRWELQSSVTHSKKFQSMENVAVGLLAHGSELDLEVLATRSTPHPVRVTGHREHM